MTSLRLATPHDFELTDEQQAAVDSDASALVVTAPAGTGKTETLTRRTERFVNDPASGHARVLVVTYTTRAAKEFEARLRGRIGHLMQRITADTVHGFSHTLLTTHGTHVGLPPDFQVLSNDADRVDLLASYENSRHPEDCASLLGKLDLARARDESHPLLQTWRNALEDKGAVDFNEMIAKATEVLRIPALGEMMRRIYGLVVVDEAQNLTRQQYDFISALIGRSSTNGPPLVPTTLLGDPNQSVTGFAGGDSGLMERFANDYDAMKIPLNRNFRSSHRLALLERNVSQELGTDHKRAESGAGCAAEGVVECHEFDDEQEEAAFIAKWVTELLEAGLPDQAVSAKESNRLDAEQIAVLARHASALNATSKALEDHGHEVARAHNDSDLMSSPHGALALELMRFRSDRHRTSAEAALKREFGLEFTKAPANARNGAIRIETRMQQSDGLSCLKPLAPLLEADSPEAFVAALEECHLPRYEPEPLLTSWTADRHLISEAWSEFANITPLAERSWTRFALHLERTARGRDLGPGVRLLTVHKAQAREFKAVAIIGMNDGQFPDFRAESAEASQSELQTFYVAATRASRVLVLTRARKRPTRYGDRPTEPSPFLKLVCDPTGSPSSHTADPQRWMAR